MNLACQKFKASKKTYSKCEKIVFSNGPAPKCTFMDNGDTLEVIKQQFFHVLALLILQSQETSMYRSVKGYVWYNKTNLVI